MFHVKRFTLINQTYVLIICNSIRIYITKHIINKYVTAYNFIFFFITLYIYQIHFPKYIYNTL